MRTNREPSRSRGGPADSATSETPRLDPRSSLPLHAQAERVLRELIQRPAYRAGRLLPDEVSIAKSLGVSRNTLRAAISRLVTEGRLERKAGVGTRVVEPRVNSGIGAWHSFTREMAAKGVQVDTLSVQARMRPAPEEAARALQLPAGTAVLCLDRVRGWEGRPEVHFRSYLHPRLGLTTASDFQQPLYALIRQQGRVDADQSLEELKAINADRRLARLLDLPVGTALLRRARTVLDPDRRPMEYAVVHYRCERFTLTLNLRKE